MKLTDKESREGVSLCLDNAKRLLKDAKLLLANGSTGHALFLVVSAIEETSKAFIFAGARIGIWKRGETDSEVITHFPKLTLFVSHVAAVAMEDSFRRTRERIFRPQKPAKPLDIDDFVEMAQDVDYAVKELWRGRCEGLYVDRRSGEWTAPSDVEKSEVETLMKRTERYVADTEYQTRNILEAKKDTALNYRRWLEEEYVPFAINYFLENIDKLFDEKVISRRLYEKLREVKSKRGISNSKSS